jgi:hypothetical protein
MAMGIGGTKTIVIVILAVNIAVAAKQCQAQEARFELGQRVRAFEVAWEQQTDATAHARAVPHLNTAVMNFFSFKLDEAARSLDQARFAMQLAPPPATMIWATALSLKPETRLVDRSSPMLSVSIRWTNDKFLSSATRWALPRPSTSCSRRAIPLRQSLL